MDYLAKPCAHFKIDEWINTGVGEAAKVNGKHREEELAHMEKVFLLKLSNDGNQEVWIPADDEGKNNDQHHFGNLEK